MKKNYIRVIVTNTELYEGSVATEVKNIVNHISTRMRCIVDNDSLIIGPPTTHPVFGQVIQAEAEMKTKNRSKPYWGTCYSIHFHESLGFDGFYERQLFAAFINRARNIIKEIKKEGTHGLQFSARFKQNWIDFKKEQEQRAADPEHPIHKKATKLQILNCPSLIFDVFSELAIQFLANRITIIDVTEITKGNPDDRIFSVGASLFITTEPLTEAPSVTIAREEAETPSA